MSPAVDAASHKFDQDYNWSLLLGGLLSTAASLVLPGRGVYRAESVGATSRATCAACAISASVHATIQLPLHNVPLKHCSVTGTRYGTCTSVLKPPAAINAGWVPLILGSFRGPSKVQSELRRPVTGNANSFATHGHTTKASSMSCCSIGNPCLHSFFLSFVRHEGNGLRTPCLSCI